eukprot:1188550-Prorocentrum_minimum.AAC.2
MWIRGGPAFRTLFGYSARARHVRSPSSRGQASAWEEPPHAPPCVGHVRSSAPPQPAGGGRRWRGFGRRPTWRVVSTRDLFLPHKPKTE